MVSFRGNLWLTLWELNVYRGRLESQLASSSGKSKDTFTLVAFKCTQRDSTAKCQVKDCVWVEAQSQGPDWHSAAAAPLGGIDGLRTGFRQDQLSAKPTRNDYGPHC